MKENNIFPDENDFVIGNYDINLQPNNNQIHPVVEKTYTRAEVLDIVIESEEFTSNYGSRTNLTRWFNTNYPL